MDKGISEKSIDEIIAKSCENCYLEARGRLNTTIPIEAMKATQAIKKLMEKRFEFMKSWNCDNPNCGRGAICNFCALRKDLTQAIEEM